ncbi:hypothetical protein R3X25_02315 [Lutibacter sp. TH_r2]|uniref:HNH endonuclease n=1 Tax=Lutibacter sp. TH_r2 TaxID=3082083 RepID=UPI002953B017|nr:hypothetical protein [Lutibacter sp. TH_r2]MDV7186103.1 hypothetical protein [Lutibacter sp. TH_r2]
MLFTYSYINHEAEKFQKYLDFIFFEVWCKAKGDFNSKKLRGFKELQLIYEGFHYDESKGGQFFNSHIELIFEEFKELDKRDIKKLKKWYRINNNVSLICSNRTIKPINYKKLEKNYPELGKLFKSFYSKLYGNKSPFNLKVFGNFKKIIKSHYNDFMEANEEEICPFCGIKEIKGKNHSKREAYDHYIPKGKYPFNSVNFKNLVPMCNDCNSSYKLEQELHLKNEGKGKNKTFKRRKVFYPYTHKKWILNVNFELKSLDIQNLKKKDFEISISTFDEFSHKDHLAGWKETFGIEERYKAKILRKKRGAKKWVNQLENELKNFQRLTNNVSATKFDYCNYMINESEIDKLDNSNFLKSEFLKEWSHRSKQLESEQ